MSADNSNVVYIIGTVLAIVLLFVCLRRVFVRRAQMAQREQTAFGPTQGHGRVGMVVIGGGWRDGGVGGIGYGRDYQSPAWPPAAATAGRPREEPEIPEQLPQYEASPPEYDVIYKNGAPPPVGQRGAPVELAEEGESSAAAAVAAAPASSPDPVSQSQPAGGDVGVDIGTAHA